MFYTCDLVKACIRLTYGRLEWKYMKWLIFWTDCWVFCNRGLFLAMRTKNILKSVHPTYLLQCWTWENQGRKGNRSYCLPYLVAGPSSLLPPLKHFDSHHQGRKCLNLETILPVEIITKTMINNFIFRILQNVEVDHFKIQHIGTNTCLQFRYKILSTVVLKDCN